jgi:transcriptional regulator with XRE-family HTH domain
MPKVNLRRSTKLGKRLQELRGEVSLYEVEKQTGVSRINVSRYEKGVFLPTDTVLKKLADFYQVSYADLRILYYDDFFNKDLMEKEIALRWAKRVLGLEKAEDDADEWD